MKMEDIKFCINGKEYTVPKGTRFFYLPKEVQPAKIYEDDLSNPPITNFKVLEYHIEKKGWFNGVKRIFGELEEIKSENEIKNAILNGENETIEFKEYNKKIDKNWENDIVDTVGAFANFKGGTIYLGIKDNLEISGLNYGKIKTEEELRNYIRKFISDNLNKQIEINFKLYKFKGKEIMAIQIHEGNDKPYYNIFTKIPNIRRGANNMKADPNTDLREMFESGKGYGIFAKIKARKKFV